MDSRGPEMKMRLESRDGTGDLLQRATNVKCVQTEVDFFGHQCDSLCGRASSVQSVVEDKTCLRPSILCYGSPPTPCSYNRLRLINVASSISTWSGTKSNKELPRCFPSASQAFAVLEDADSTLFDRPGDFPEVVMLEACELYCG